MDRTNLLSERFYMRQQLSQDSGGSLVNASLSGLIPRQQIEKSVLIEKPIGWNRK